MLSCRALRHRVGERMVLDEISLRVDAGEAYGLVGPRGSGKSSVARAACGFQRVDSGSVLVDGRPVEQIGADELRGLVGYVAQSVVLASSETVAGTLRMWARLFSVPATEREERIDEVLATTGLAARRDERVGQSSAGVLRELSLAVTLLSRPRLLVLDEPTVGIGPRSARRLLATLAGLRADGRALLVTARTTTEIASLCTQIGTMHRGRRVSETYRDREPVA